MSVGQKMQMAAAGAGGETGVQWDIREFEFNSGDTADRWPTAIGTSTLYPSPQISTVFRWGDSGYKIYLFYRTGGSYIYQINCTTAYDMSTASASWNKRFYIGPYESYATGLFFKPDGTRFYIIGTSQDKVQRFDMSTAWDVSTASNTSSNNSPSFATTDTNMRGLHFKSDGTKFFMAGNTNKYIYEFSMTTAWDVSTASVTSNTYQDTRSTNFYEGVDFSPDGTKLYRHAGSSTYQSDLTTAWDITTASTVSNGYIPYPDYDFIDYWFNSIDFNSDGTAIYIPSSESGNVTRFPLSTAYVLSSASAPEPAAAADYYSTASLLGFSSNVGTATISEDGTKWFIVYGSSSGNALRRYDMSTAGDLSTSSYTSGLSSTSLYLNRYTDSMVFKPDGTQIIWTNALVGGVGGFNTAYMTTAWDITTLGNQTYTSFGNFNFGDGFGIYVSPDGTKLFIIRDNIELYKYTMTTGWDVSTISSSATQTATIKNLHPTVPTFYNVTFSSDGYYMYTIHKRTDHAPGLQWVSMYELSTAWDLSTATRIADRTYGTLSSELNAIEFFKNGRQAMLVSKESPDALAIIKEYP